MKAVFHIDETAKWDETTKNIHNLFKEVPEAVVVVSVNGGAVKGYLAAENQAFIKEDKAAFHACRNALRAQHIAESQLPPNVKVVPAGVLDLIELQASGYAYIKP
ncbi:MAG: DsrE family protein [Enterococcaceae bacterium]|jgi:intracellular sulfur oxidation DsrE/DsrF family protein|nr:DsrE family protein [Enterococcaceae bacterium]MCI1919286.1 DsrE family protein [Enterococcaceae bacterium]